MKHTKKLMILTLLITTTILYSSSPRFWVVDNVKEFMKGTFKGTYIEADGTLKVMPYYKITNLSKYSIWKAIKYNDGYIFISNRPQGIYFVEDNRVYPILEDPNRIFTDIIKFHGKIYISSSPGKIFILKGRKIIKTININENYIWKLFPYKGKILITTGDRGRLYKLDDSQTVKKILDIGKGHIMSIAAKKDKIFLGVSGGYIYIYKEGEAHIFAKIDENEIVSIKNIRGDIYIIANKVRYKKPAIKKAKSILSFFDFSKRDNILILYSGTIYKFSKRGDFGQIARFPKEMLTDVEGFKKGVLISSGSKGMLYYYKEFPGINYFLDTDAKKIISITKEGKNLIATTSDGGKIIEIYPQKIYEDATYISNIFDTQFLSRIGTTSWETNTDEIKVYIRLGNTSKPDKNWTNWIRVKNGEKIKNYAFARYIQFKILFPEEENAFIRTIKISYRGYNRSPFIKRITYDDKIIYNYENATLYNKSKKKKNPTLDGIEAKNKATQNTSKSYKKEKTKPRNPRKVVKVIAEDPDNDKIMYYFFIKRNIDEKWIPLLEGKPTYQGTIYINTDYFPDGIYRLKIIATDIKNNPRYFKKDIKITKEFIIDNTPPTITELIYYPDKNIIYGKIKDNVSKVVEVSYLINGGTIFPAIPLDGIFDSKRETFIIKLPKNVSPKEVVSVLIIAKDELGNQTSRIFEYTKGIKKEKIYEEE